MNLALLLALVSGTAWGVNIVVVRWALTKTGARSDVGALVSIGAAALVATVAAVVSGADTSGLGFDTIGRFALVGAIAPGAAQVFFMAAIRSIGAARGGVIIGTAPMFGVVLAIVFLDESWKLGIVVGTVATVAGGTLLSWSPESAGEASPARRETFAYFGVVLAALTAIMFGVRDVVARHFTSANELAVPWAAVIVLTSGTVILLLMTLLRTRNLIAEVKSALPPMLWSGLFVGLALPTLLAALSRGEVGVVAPVNNGAQVLAAVALASLFLGRAERSTRILVALALVIAGGTIIGVTQ